MFLYPDSKVASIKLAPRHCTSAHFVTIDTNLNCFHLVTCTAIAHLFNLHPDWQKPRHASLLSAVYRAPGYTLTNPPSFKHSLQSLSNIYLLYCRAVIVNSLQLREFRAINSITIIRILILSNPTESKHLSYNMKQI